MLNPRDCREKHFVICTTAAAGRRSKLKYFLRLLTQSNHFADEKETLHMRIRHSLIFFKISVNGKSVTWRNQSLVERIYISHLNFNIFRLQTFFLIRRRKVNRFVFFSRKYKTTDRTDRVKRIFYIVERRTKSI